MFRAIRRWPSGLATFAVALAGSAGCGAVTGTADARRAAAAFYADVTAHQDRRACADLAPQAAKSLETSDSSCAEEIGKLKLNGGRILASHVWGDRAQVVLSGDTLFLARFPEGWKVTAAGCRPQPKAPYDCDVEA